MLKDDQRAEMHLETALAKLESDGIVLSEKALETLDFFIRVHHTFADDETARRMIEVMLYFQPKNRTAMTAKAEMSTDDVAHEIYNEMLARNLNAFHRFNVAFVKYRRLCMDYQTNTDKALSNAKKFASPKDPSLLLWFFENFYRPNEEWYRQVQEDHENLNYVSKAAEEEVHEKEKSLVKFENESRPAITTNSGTDWGDLFNRFLLIQAQARSGFVDAACLSFLKYLRRYGPTIFDEIFGIERGNESTNYDESSVYYFVLVTYHIGFVAATDHEMAMKMWDVICSSTDFPNYGAVLSEHTLMALSNGIKDTAERKKFWLSVLQIEKNNIIAQKELGMKDKMEISTEGGGTGTIEKILVYEPKAKGKIGGDEDQNHEWKESFFPHDEEEFLEKQRGRRHRKLLKDWKKDNKGSVEEFEKWWKENPNDQLPKKAEQKSAKAEHDDSVNKEVSETVCAFLNVNDGKLYIGVANDGTVIGVDRDLERSGETDIIKQKDWLKKHITEKVKSHFGQKGDIRSCKPTNLFTELVKYSWEVRPDSHGEDKTILKLKVKALPKVTMLETPAMLSDVTNTMFDKDGVMQDVDMGEVAYFREVESNMPYKGQKLNELLVNLRRTNDEEKWREENTWQDG